MIAAAGGNEKKAKSKFGIGGEKVVYLYEPKQDMNVHELALLIPFFTQAAIVGFSMQLFRITKNASAVMGTPESIDVMWRSFPKGAQRHFRVIDPPDSPSILQAKHRLQLPGRG